jgi:hypothetical protein
MSGPKVVRVISREELVAAGEALLARLDAAIAQWQRECAGNVTPADEQRTRSRREELEAILRNNRFTEFGQAAANEIGYLEVDAVNRKEKAAEAKAQVLARFSNGRELARTLLKNQTSLTEQVRDELLKATNGELTLADMDSIFSKVKQSMFNQADQKITPEQKAIASRLSDDVVDQTFEEWKTKTVRPDERLLEVFRHLSDLELIGDVEIAAELSLQLSQIQSMDDDPIRQMRLDTLIVNVRNAKQGANAKAKLLRSAELLAAELEGFDPTSETSPALKNLKWSESLEKIGALTALGEKELIELRAANAASARRRAVLAGLEKLGYELHEGLSTATTASGRIVVRNPSDNGYGVEVVGGAGSEKLQVRSVAFDSSRDATQDIPEEKRWCDDFGKLQTALRAEGCEIIIEKALGVGTTPIKVLETVEDERRRSISKKSQAGRAR